MDLSTDYMGLALRNPLVASRVAAVADRRRRARDWPTRASARSCSTRCSRSSCAARRS